MAKFILKRLVTGILSVMVATLIIMILIYSLMSRELIFASDTLIQKQLNNSRETFKMRKWEEYGYLDYVPYSEYMKGLLKKGEISQETFDEAVKIGRKPERDSDAAKPYIEQFIKYYESKGYTVKRMNAVMNGKKIATGGTQQLFAYKDKPLIGRAAKFFGGIFKVDNIHYVNDDIDIGKRGLTFTWHDPVYGGEKFSPALIGNGTQHKYLLYFTDSFPFIHQNLLKIKLGTSYSINRGVDVFDTMITSQGTFVKSTVNYPTGLKDERADDLHTATYVQGSRELDAQNKARFTDDYTRVFTHKNTMSKVGFSFTITIIASLIGYLIGLPLGITMALKKDKIFDKISTAYIMLILAIPALAYIFMVKAIGGKAGLPIMFDLDKGSILMFVLPIISLSLRPIADTMKWIRRFMVDQMNSDYVRFARSGGLAEGEIFKKHIFKNAFIPLVHGIPGTIIFAISGAFYTESVYLVPGTGKMLIEAIQKYDNSAIVGLALFFGLLTVISLILGDVLMALVDPRISFVEKAR